MTQRFAGMGKAAGPAPGHPTRMLLGLAGLLVIVAIVYWPGLRGGFVFDDYVNIVENRTLHVGWASTWREWLAAAFSSPSSALHRPLASLTFAINHAFTGLDPYWMKLTNLGIHLLNTVLVFALVRLVLQALGTDQAREPAGKNQWFALWVAAAWSLNPINLMAVLFVVQRMESLCQSFVLAGLCLYITGRLRSRVDGRGRTLMFVGLFGGTAAGALAKESAVLLPVYAFILDWILLSFASAREKPDKRLLGLFVGILLLPALAGLAWTLPQVLHPGAWAGRDFTLGERLLTEGRVLVDYLHWTVLPDLGQLSLYHDDYRISRGMLDPPSTLSSLVVLVALFVAAILLRKRRPLVSLGLGWFFGAHLLTATIWPLELVYEHRNYSASLGLCLALADLLLRAPRSRSLERIGTSIALGLLLLYAGLTALRALEWNNPLRFALTEAAKHPQSPRATYDLARDYIILSDFDPASPYVDRALAALEKARLVPGATPLPESAAIVLAARTGRPVDPRWWQSLQFKLVSDPIGTEAHNALGTLARCVPIHDCSLPTDPVRATFQTALDQGRHAETLNIYGNYALNGLDDPALALRLWQEAAHRAPNVPQYQETLARMLIASGRPDLAAEPIARLRTMGRIGQHEATARQLEALASRMGRARNEGQIKPPSP